MGQKIDIRIMNLNKWYVPKSFSMDEVMEQNELVVLGYFDALQVEELQIDTEKEHPFISGYEKFEGWKENEKEKLVDYSSQEQMLFLDICENDKEDGTVFKQETVDKFWADNTSSYTFLSLIHINHSGKLEKALKKIHSVFKRDYLSYISFDYCDIVLFAHNIQISEFVIKIKQLFKIEKGKECVIFDTFSMVSFLPFFAQEQNNFYLNKQFEEEIEFQATINLSIRDYNKFNEWYSALGNLAKEVKKFNLFGRHDISLINERANSVWLMQIMEKLHKKDISQEIFWTFETYIKIEDKDDIGMNSNKPEYPGIAYKAIKENLNKEIDEFKKVLEYRNIYRFLLPVYEVRDCICSIAKNNFAEEFVYCIYESFLHFIAYIKNEIKNSNNKKIEWVFVEEKIAKVYDKYFTAINTLVNSTMHSERQFVQATAFNAVFYSVPPKIMAFYNSYIYRIKQILSDKNCNKQYTFLIYPSFTPTISVEQISLDNDPPSDRILTVKISERALYDIESVLYQMVHEQAHYVGDRLRCRCVRKEKIVDTLLKHIIMSSEKNKKREECEETYKALIPFVKRIMISDEEDSKEFEYLDYLEYTDQEGKRLRQILEDPVFCKKAFEEYYRQKVSDDINISDDILYYFGIEGKEQRIYIENMLTQYSDIKFEIFRENLKNIDINADVLRYQKLINILRKVYSESYADLQMVLVLAMGEEDYLDTFFTKQNISIEDMILRMEKDAVYMLRISTVYRVMKDSEIWGSTVCKNKELEKIIELIDLYNNVVEEETSQDRYVESQDKLNQIKKIFKSYDFNDGLELKRSSKEKTDKMKRNENIESLTYIAIGLYEYLLEVIKDSLTEYSRTEKIKEILEVRKIVKKILTFKNIREAFGCIEAELDYYKKVGCKI